MNDQLRALFPVTQRAIYLNHAAISAPPTPTIQAIEGYLADISQNGSLNFRKWLAVKESARTRLANLLGARAEQVAFVRNTSDALSSVANGLKWESGDNIVTFRHEFPSNIYPWLRLRDAYGVDVRMCTERDGRMDPDELSALVDSRTRLVAISYVQYATGFRSDLERIAQAIRKHDGLLVVDVIQALGVVPTDVEAQLVDVAAGACHKWLLTPEGIGFLYLSDRARERIQPTLVGWVSVTNPDDTDNFDQEWNKGTLPWESGTSPAGLLHGLDVSLKLLTEIGPEVMERRLAEVTDCLCERLADTQYEILSSRAPHEKSQIVSIRHRGQYSPMDLFSHLKQRSVVTAPRGHGLRISPHIYNTLEEIEEFIRLLP